ncbi:DNA topoisomerase 2-binding protein 1 [Coemansia biformis]|uniref:DNA topoisomerase 2-binding protein 1 n=1 Tax=Coemansia biformis TaxID=1286918 RepID=A0A9W7YBM4_9FUNG|nr:DNA topoisomerase 2-binding protein 1 [Coemansia biformis]
MPALFPLLADCCVSCSGFEADDKEAVHQRIEQLGGSVSFQLTSLVTHVIVKDSLASNKYRVSARIGIPVVSIEFLDECEKEARRRSLPSLRSLGGGNAQRGANATADVATAVRQATERTWYRPFSGCLVCTTGFDLEVREEMKCLITDVTPRDSCRAAGVFARHIDGFRPDDFVAMPKLIGGGGSYNGVLTPACTHLVAQSPTGQKYKFARQWGVCVRLGGSERSVGHSASIVV